MNLDLSKLQVNKDELPELKPLGPIFDLPTEHINGMIMLTISVSVKDHKTRLTSRRYIIQNLEHIYSNTILALAKTDSK